MLSLAERSSHLHMLSMHTVTLLSWRKGDTGMLISEGGMRTLNCYWCFSNRCCALILGLVKKRCRGSFFFPPIEHEQIPVSDDRSANLCKLRQWPPLITAISIVSELLFTLLSFSLLIVTPTCLCTERERECDIPAAGMSVTLVFSPSGLVSLVYHANSRHKEKLTVRNHRACE